MKLIVLAALFACISLAQQKITNPSFELGELGAPLLGWFIPPVIEKAGFGLKLVDQGCRSGKCAMLTGVADPPPNMFGNMIQAFGANGYTLRRIRLRAAIRVEGERTRAQMWLRLDRADRSMAFLDNMGTRPVTSSSWNTYDIETEVPEDVTGLVFGVMVFGPGSAWVDDFSLEILEEVDKDKVEPARPITTQGLVNLTAFARLYGYVRFFHPSDQAAKTDWETFAIEGVRAAESAASAAELIERLQKSFSPIAPTLRVFAQPPPPTAAALEPGPEIVRYVHNGVELPTGTMHSVYKSARERTPATGHSLPPEFEAELVPGVRVSMPVALYADPQGTLPHIPLPPPPLLYDRTTGDRATRLAGVLIAWNVFQHFYPYFDVVKTDWPAELPKALQTAATDTTRADFEKTLQHLVAALKDGHGGVSYVGHFGRFQVPLAMDWIQGQFVVTRARTDAVHAGDRVLKIDGKPIDRYSTDVQALIPGATPQWIRYRSIRDLSECNPHNKMTLDLEPFSSRGTTTTVTLDCVAPKYKDPEWYTEPRPAKPVIELEPGIYYIDLDRVTPTEWKEAVPQLQSAKGIIFDMRGYPGQPALDALAHLTDTAIRSAKWNVGSARLPDRLDTKWDESGWPVPPQKPYLNAKRVFLTDGRAISYAETVMGMVEAFHLGEIVGEPTAGTNGNINPFKLPGGFTITWTGMKVLKHDGSQHHGIGILPTVPASRTRKGVAEGKDELLLKSLEIVKK